MEEQPSNEKKHWTENVLFKVVIIGFLILALMIPSVMINELVRERSSRKHGSHQRSQQQMGTIADPYRSLHRDPLSGGSKVH